MSLELGERERDAIAQHGRESYRDEACGVMLGHFDDGHRIVIDVEPLENAREDERHRRFVVTPDDYRRAEQRAAARDLTLLGFYHSHPDHPAYPSQFDLEHAFPFFSYVIVSVMSGQPREMRSFVLAADRARFEEEAVTITRKVS